MTDSPHPPGGECRSCPVCLALQVLDDVRPEVAEHLAAAGRELVLALRAALVPTNGHGGPWASPPGETNDTVHDRAHDHATASHGAHAVQQPPAGTRARAHTGAGGAAAGARTPDATGGDRVGSPAAAPGVDREPRAPRAGTAPAPRHLRRIDITGPSSS